MWALMIVKGDPVTDSSASMLNAFEALSVRALFFKRTNNTFHHAVLLWAMRCNKFLSQAITAHQRSVMARSKNQAVIRTQKKRRVDATKRAKPSNQGLL